MVENPKNAQSAEPTEEDFENAGYLPPEGTSFNAPFQIGVAALAAAFFSRVVPWLGALLGIVAIALLVASKVPRQYLRYPRATATLGVFAIALCGFLSVYNPQPGTVSISIDAPSWRQGYGEVLVEVSGTTINGDEVNETVGVMPGLATTLDNLETGTYELSIDEACLEHEDELFEPTEPTLSLSLGLEDNVEVEFALELIPLNGILSFTVDATSWDSSYGSIPVVISGTTEDGEQINETIPATPETRYTLDEYEAGSYQFTVDQSVLKQGETVFSATSSNEEFTRREDVNVTLNIAIDEEATRALAEEKARQEAEEAARKQAEAEAAAKAEAEAEARAQAQAEEERQRQQEVNSQTVYITRTGEKYHRSGCQYLRKSCIPISLSEAQSRGYEPCSRCW